MWKRLVAGVLLVILWSNTSWAAGRVCSCDPSASQGNRVGPVVSGGVEYTRLSSGLYVPKEVAFATQRAASRFTLRTLYEFTRAHWAIITALIGAGALLYQWTTGKITTEELEQRIYQALERAGLPLAPQ